MLSISFLVIFICFINSLSICCSFYLILFLFFYWQYKTNYLLKLISAMSTWYNKLFISLLLSFVRQTDRCWLSMFWEWTIVGAALFVNFSNDPVHEYTSNYTFGKLEQLIYIELNCIVLLPVSISFSFLKFEFLWRTRNGEADGDGCGFY